MAGAQNRNLTNGFRLSISPQLGGELPMEGTLNQIASLRISRNRRDVDAATLPALLTSLQSYRSDPTDPLNELESAMLMRAKREKDKDLKDLETQLNAAIGTYERAYGNVHIEHRTENQMSQTFRLDAAQRLDEATKKAKALGEKIDTLAHEIVEMQYDPATMKEALVTGVLEIVKAQNPLSLAALKAIAPLVDYGFLEQDQIEVLKRCGAVQKALIENKHEYPESLLSLLAQGNIGVYNKAAASMRNSLRFDAFLTHTPLLGAFAFLAKSGLSTVLTYSLDPLSYKALVGCSAVAVAVTACLAASLFFSLKNPIYAGESVKRLSGFTSASLVLAFSFGMRIFKDKLIMNIQGPENFEESSSLILPVCLACYAGLANMNRVGFQMLKEPENLVFTLKEEDSAAATAG